MDATDFLYDYLRLHGQEKEYHHFEEFFKGWSDQEFDLTLTKNILANTDFKHRLAKYIVRSIMYDDRYYYIPDYATDLRLQCFIAYYLVKEILNSQPKLNECTEQTLKSLIGVGGIANGEYLPGYAFNPNEWISPVRMQPGEGLHPGYRNFIINLLCFNSSKFVMGCRCDSGPVLHMKFHKGCSPLGYRKDKEGNSWTLFNIDKTLTDDCTAIFSNGLEGDGTVEVCDWVSDQDVRVVFRCNF